VSVEVSTPSLTDFLLARIAEDEEAVRSALKPQWSGTPTFYTTFNAQRDDWGLWLFNVPPDRLLAECEAKRRIVEMAQAVASQEAELRALADADPMSEDAADMLAIMGGVRTGTEAACDALALPYAEHPDFDPAWRL
jgi:hypothetical protein